MNELEIYTKAMSDYRKAASVGDWIEAEKNVRIAIANCPVPEALDSLSELHRVAHQRAYPNLVWRGLKKIGVAN